MEAACLCVRRAQAHGCGNLTISQPDFVKQVTETDLLVNHDIDSNALFGLSMKQSIQSPLRELC